MIGRPLAIAIIVLMAVSGFVLGTQAGLRVVAEAVTSLTDGKLQLQGGRGRLISDVGFELIRYDDAGVSVEIESVDTRLRWEELFAGRVHAEYLKVDAVRVTTRPQPPPEDPEPLTLLAPLPIRVDEGVLREFVLLDDVGKRQWGLGDAEFAMAWVQDWFSIDRLSATTSEAGRVTLAGRVGINKDRLRFRAVHVEGPGVVDIAGHVALGDAENKLNLAWRRLAWPGLDVVRLRPGTLSLVGPWSSYEWALKTELVAEQIEADLDGAGRGSLQGLNVQRLDLAALGGTIRGAGAVNWAKGLRANFDARLAGVNPGMLDDKWPGRVNGEARLDIVVRDDVPQINFDAKLVDSVLRGYPLALDARGSTESQRFALDSLLLTSGKSRLKAAGQVLPALKLNAELDSPDLRALWVGLSGSTTLKLGLTGTTDAPRITVSGTASKVAYTTGDQAYTADELTISAKLDGQSESTVSIRADRLDVGVLLSHVELQARGSEKRHRLKLDIAGGLGTAALELAGGLQKQQWNGTLSNLVLVHHNGSGPVNGAGNGNGPTRWQQEDASSLRVSDAGVRLEPTCLAHGAERACFDADTRRDRQAFATRIQSLRMHHLRQWLPVDWTLDGTVEGTASVALRDGEIESVRTDLRSSAGQLQGGGVKMNFGQSSLVVGPDGDRLNARLSLLPADGRVDANIWLNGGSPLLDRRLDGRIEAHLPDLAWLPVLTHEIASAAGSLDAEFKLSGTARNPAAAGSMKVTDGRLLLTTPGIELTELTAEVTSTEATVLGVLLNAQSGGGPLQLQGGIDRLRPQLSGRFRLTGQDAQMLNTPEARAWVTPDLELVLAGPDSTLNGKIVVPKARIRPAEIKSTGVSPSSDQVIVSSRAPSPDKDGLRLTSEVTIVLGDDVRINGLGLKTRLEGAIDASDRPGRSTRGRGELRLVGGRYKAYGQDLTIETGRLLFTGGPVSEPGIDLSAYRQPIDTVRVGLRARGTLKAPEFSLYSDPAMSQEEQLSWLVLGRPLNETLQSGQRTELDNAATSLGLAGGEYLANRLIAPRLGVDEVSVGTRPGETNEHARLTIGKYLSPRLFVSYGFGLFQPGRFLRMQYDLGRGFKLTGESGEHQGGDVIYTFER